MLRRFQLEWLCLGRRVPGRSPSVGELQRSDRRAGSAARQTTALTWLAGCPASSITFGETLLCLQSGGDHWRWRPARQRRTPRRLRSPRLRRHANPRGARIDLRSYQFLLPLSTGKEPPGAAFEGPAPHEFARSPLGRLPETRSVQEAAKRARARRVLQLPQRLGLDLPDA